MKSSQLILVLLVVAAAGLVIATHLDAQPNAGKAAGPIAVCNVVEILNNCQKAKDLTAELNKKTKIIGQEDEKRAKAIDQLTNELKAAAPGSEVHDRLFAEKQRLLINREAWLKFEQATAMRTHQKLSREMYSDVQKAVAIVAKSRGFKIVLHQRRGRLRGKNTAELLSEISQRKVVYSDESVDITASVLSSLNAKYRSKP
jgi:Skp family chaperone for outer membrane proteins